MYFASLVCNMLPMCGGFSFSCSFFFFFFFLVLLFAFLAPYTTVYGIKPFMYIKSYVYIQFYVHMKNRFDGVDNLALFWTHADTTTHAPLLFSVDFILFALCTREREWAVISWVWTFMPIRKRCMFWKLRRVKPNTCSTLIIIGYCHWLYLCAIPFSVGDRSKSGAPTDKSTQHTAQFPMLILSLSLCDGCVFLKFMSLLVWSVTCSTTTGNA